jgi:hypothetical protein
MNDIVEALQKRIPGSPAIGLVIGLSGTGKTQISLKYAHDHDDEYVPFSPSFGMLILTLVDMTTLSLWMQVLPRASRRP